MNTTDVVIGIVIGYLMRNQITGLWGGMRSEEKKLKGDLNEDLNGFGALAYGAVGVHGHRGATGHPGQGGLSPLGGYGAVQLNPRHKVHHMGAIHMNNRGYGAIQMNPRHL